MTKSQSLKKLTLCSLAAVVCGAGQSAYAHTGVKDKGAEGSSLYTGFTIGHGCQDGDELLPRLPVIAQSAVFPNGLDSIATRSDTGAVVNIADHIKDIDVDTPIALAPNLIQDTNVFKKMKEIADPNVTVGAHATPNVRAFNLTNGKLQLDLVGVVPFNVSGVNFQTASCAKSLKVRIAIANWCSKTNNTDKDNRVDVWMGATTPLFNDAGVVSTGFWPTLTINRTTALGEGCGEGYDVILQPSPADIDNYLPINGYWPK